MKKLSVLFLSILLFSCSKKEGNEGIEGIACLSSASLKVKSLEIENGSGRQWIENYFYDSADRIVRIEDSSFDGRLFEMEYSDDHLTKVNVTDLATNSIDRLDSLGYDLSGNVVSAYTFSLNPIKDDFDPWIFEYGDDGRIKELTSNWRTLKFTWTGNNITKVEHFDENQERLYDATYEFDENKNYLKGLYQTTLYAAYNFMRPEYWNENNITRWDRFDHIEFQYDNGTNEHGCPCDIEYEYNDDCYPVRIERGGITNITYY